MKRQIFKGLRASHGVSKARRSQGSSGLIGISRVFKGKKMAGHYGNTKITLQTLLVVYCKELTLDDTNGVMIGVHGSVPGCRNGWRRISNTSV